MDEPGKSRMGGWRMNGELLFSGYRDSV